MDDRVIELTTAMTVNETVHRKIMLKLIITTLLTCSAVAADKKPPRQITDAEKQTLCSKGPHSFQ